MTPLKDDNTSKKPSNPLITRELFSEILEFIKIQGDRFDKLCAIAESISGEYVNFWPHCKYDVYYIKLLNGYFGIKNDEDSMISFFIVDLDFGRNQDLLKTLSYKNSPLDLSTPEKLYDFCVETYLTPNVLLTQEIQTILEAASTFASTRKKRYRSAKKKIQAQQQQSQARQSQEDLTHNEKHI